MTMDFSSNHNGSGNHHTILPPTRSRIAQYDLNNLQHTPLTAYQNQNQSYVHGFDDLAHPSTNAAYNDFPLFTDDPENNCTEMPRTLEEIQNQITTPPEPNAPASKRTHRKKQGKKKSSSSKGVSRRTKNYSREEDRVLCSAYLNVCKDPIVGVNQTSETYWDRIHAYFHSQHNFAEDRSAGSLSKRWGDIQLQTARFCGCIAEQNRLNQSGKTEQDRLEDALKQYEALYGGPYKYLHCWEILKNQNKWQVHLKHKEGCKGKGVRDETEDITLDSSSDEEEERPMGRDSAKKRRTNSNAVGSASSSALEVMQKMNHNRELKMQLEAAWAEDFKSSNERLISIKEQEVAMQVKAREDRIMLQPYSDLDEWQREYLQSERKAIIMKRRAQAGSSSGNNSQLGQL